MSRRCFALVLLVPMPACGDDDAAAGSIRVTAYGEEFIEEGIPAEVFADGWSIDFERFLVAISAVSVGTGSGPPALTSPQTRVVDLARPTAGAGHVLVSGEVPGGRYDDTGYTLGPAAAGALPVDADAADVTLMLDGGFSLYVEGAATKGDVTKSFAWGFTTRVVHHECESTANVDGGTATVQLTLHADHLFYDSLVSAEPDVRFQLFADADADADDALSLDELAAIDITGLPNYQVGNRTDVDDLRAFLEAQTATVGHIDGEGHCHTE